MNLKKFPNVSCKEIYLSFSAEASSPIEEKYPLYRWKHIWANIHLKYIDKYDRVICYTFLYEALPTKKRLKAMNIRDIENYLCPICVIPETNIHLFFFLQQAKISI